MTDRLRNAAAALLDRWDGPHWRDFLATATYMEELRAALAEQEAAGGAWCVYDEETNQWIPTNTAPPRREWKGLTDEERNDLWREVVGWGDPSHDDEDLMKAIEAKLKGKNHA